MTTPDPDRAHAVAPQAGVLLVNLGTPDAPTPAAIRRYLRQFLSDPRVVEIPRAIWLPILHLFILPLRPRRLAHAYQSIWRDDGSPLLAISKQQTAAIRLSLKQKLGRDIPVALAMTYGTPGISAALKELESQNVRRLLLLPLFPQYSASTTAAVLDAVFAEFGRQRWPPALRTIDCYHDEPAYIDALAASVRAHWVEKPRGEHLLMSFHGIPQRYVLSGDPYYCQCQKTARLLAEALHLRLTDWSLAFQSRFGKAPWVQPYAEQAIAKLADRGVRVLDVICPGFAADCPETLEEISLRYAAVFAMRGGRAFNYIPALNTTSAHIEALSGLAEHHLQDWLPALQGASDSAARMQRAAEARGAFDGSAAS